MLFPNSRGIKAAANLHLALVLFFASTPVPVVTEKRLSSALECKTAEYFPEKSLTGEFLISTFRLTLRLQCR